MPSEAEVRAEIASIKNKRLDSGTAPAQLQALKDEIRAIHLARFEESESKFLDQSYIEDKLGGKVEYGQELPNFWLQRGVSVREELDRAVDYANNSGRLPEGITAYGVTDRNGDNFVAYKVDGENTYYALNDPGPSLGDWGSEFGASVLSAETFLGALVELALPQKKLLEASRKLYRLGRLVSRGLSVGLGTGAGRGLDEWMESFSDKDVQAWDSIQEKMIESGMWGVGAQLLVAEPFEVAAAKLKQYGFSPKKIWEMSKRGATPEEIEELSEVMEMSSSEVTNLLRAISEEELPPLGMGELNIPIARRAQAQAAGVSPEAARREREKVSAPARRMIESKYNVDSITELDDKALEEVVARQEQQAIALMNKSFRDAGIDFSSTTKEIGGKTAAETVLDYKKTSSAAATRKYDKIFDIAAEEGIEFDISGAIAQAREEVATLSLRGRPKERVDRWMDPSSPDAVVERTVTETDVEIPGPVEGRLELILNALTEANDLQGTDRLVALRQLRTTLSKLAEPDPNRITSTPNEAAAYRVLKELNESINGTMNTGSDAYRAAVSDANEFWTERMSNLDAFGYMANMNTLGAGEKIYNRLFTGQLTDLEAKFLIDNMTPARLKEFRSALYTDMQRHPEKIESTIRGMDRAGERIIPENAKQVLIRYRREYEKLNKRLAGRLLNEQYRRGERVGVLVEKGDVTDIRELIDAGAMTEEDVSRAVVQKFVSDTTDYDDGEFVINRAKYERHFRHLEETGIIDVVSPTAKSMLENIRVYSSFLSHGGDSGDSIASAAIATDLLNSVQNPIGGAKAALRVAQLTMASRLAHSPALLKVIKGQQANQSFPKSRAFLLASAVEMRNLNQEKTREQ